MKRGSDQESKKDHVPSSVVDKLGVRMFEALLKVFPALWLTLVATGATTAIFKSSVESVRNAEQNR